MIITKATIESLCIKTPPLVEPFTTALLTEIGLICRVGNSGSAEGVIRKLGSTTIDLSKNTASSPYQLAPGRSIMVETLGFYRIPTGLTCRAILLSDRVEEGYSSVTNWIVPGFTGRIRFRLTNELTLSNLPVYPTLPIAQLIFEEVHLDGSRTRGVIPA